MCIRDSHRTYTVAYTSRRGIPNGRVQAVGVAGQTSPKLCRLLAFGSNHIELDLTCAHFSIFLCFAPELRDSGYMCAEDVFAVFAKPAPGASLSREQLKKLLYLCLNSSIAHVMATATPFFSTGRRWFVPLPFTQLVRHIMSLKPIVMTRILAANILVHADTITFTDQNRMFFHLAAVEALIMKQLLVVFLHEATSIVFIHDGLSLIHISEPTRPY